MKLRILWDRVENTPAVETMVREKLAGIDKYLSHVDEDLKIADVGVSRRSRWGYRVTIDLQLPGKHIYAKERTEDLRHAVVVARDHVIRQIQEHFRKLRAGQQT